MNKLVKYLEAAAEAREKVYQRRAADEEAMRAAALRAKAQAELGRRRAQLGELEAKLRLKETEEERWFCRQDARDAQRAAKDRREKTKASCCECKKEEKEIIYLMKIIKTKLEVGNNFELC